MPRTPFPRNKMKATDPRAPVHGLARVLSKLGTCSRSEAERWIRDGRVSLDGRIVRDPQFPTLIDHPNIAVDGNAVKTVEKIYVVFNKPRGLIVSAADEHGRDTIYTSMVAAGLPWLGPVGRLDKASEGMLLLTNDTIWAAGITDPAAHLDKIYHVQVAGQPDVSTLHAMCAGVIDQGDHLKAKKAVMLRNGEKNAWLEVVLDEGRNRHIRRLLAALGFDVLRLIRIAIGPLELGELPKGKWRQLGNDETKLLSIRRAR